MFVDVLLHHKKEAKVQQDNKYCIDNAENKSKSGFNYDNSASEAKHEKGPMLTQKENVLKLM